MHHSLPAPGGGCPDAQALFDSQNMYRSWHDAAPLEWDEQLAEESRDYAEQLARGGCFLRHSPLAFNRYTENLYALGGYPKPDRNCKVAADVWYGVSGGGRGLRGNAWAIAKGRGSVGLDAWYGVSGGCCALYGAPAGTVLWACQRTASGAPRTQSAQLCTVIGSGQAAAEHNAGDSTAHCLAHQRAVWLKWPVGSCWDLHLHRLA